MNTDAIAQRLQGFPPGTAEAAVRFATSRTTADLDTALLGIIEYHRPRTAEMKPIDPRDDARLTADIGLDSLSLVELSFLVSELFGLQFTDGELQGLQTLGDLRRLLRSRLNVMPAS